MLDKNTRRRLKQKAHTLKPLIQIGKNGVTPATKTNINTALKDHTLIKIRFNDHKTQKKQLTQEIIQSTDAELVDLIGNTAIIYRRKPTKKQNT
jgi:RNA-binding protein